MTDRSDSTYSPQSAVKMIPYKIDYAVKNSAKTLGFSKKRVIFKFGLANKQALDDGLSGAHCRGSEHEVQFVWSLVSGKRQLLLDGKEVHYSESGQNGWTTDRAWQHIFPLKDQSGSLRIHFISQPENKEIPGSKPFDLRVEGISYFAFNEIYKLGTPAMTIRSPSGGRGRGYNSGGRSTDGLSPEERRQIAAAKVESLRDFRKQQEQQNAGGNRQESGPAPAEDLLISFDDPPAPAPTTSVPPSGGVQRELSGITMDPSLNPPLQQQQQMYGQPQQQFAMPNYGQPPAANSSALSPYQAPGSQPAPSPYGQPAPQPAPPPPQQQPMNNYSLNGHGNPGSGYSNPMASPTGQSVASYGSAPAFAQPPPPQQQPAYPSQQQQPAYPAQQQQQQQFAPAGGYPAPAAPAPWGQNPNQAYNPY